MCFDRLSALCLLRLCAHFGALSALLRCVRTSAQRAPFSPCVPFCALGALLCCERPFALRGAMLHLYKGLCLGALGRLGRASEPIFISTYIFRFRTRRLREIGRPRNITAASAGRAPSQGHGSPIPVMFPVITSVAAAGKQP